jgi:phospholipid transport system substrate-binding protein
MTTRIRSITQPAAAIAIAMIFPVLFSSLAQAAGANTAAEVFVQQSAGKALAILKDTTLSETGKHARVEDLMSSLLDLKRMAMFTLGPAARTASPADLDLYIHAYHDFARASYSTELSAYMGQSLKVTGSSQRVAGDFIVNAQVSDPNDTSDGPTPVNFRVLDEGGGRLALVDASVAGVWFTVAERDDFRGFLSQNGGDVSKLAAHLKELSAHPAAATHASR